MYENGSEGLLVRAEPLKRGALGRTRTCGLLIRSQIWEVLGMRETPIGKRVSVR